MSRVLLHALQLPSVHPKGWGHGLHAYLPSGIPNPSLERLRIHEHCLEKALSCSPPVPSPGGKKEARCGSKLGGRRKIGVESHPELHTKFKTEANLGYTRPCPPPQKKRSKREKKTRRQGRGNLNSKSMLPENTADKHISKYSLTPSSHTDSYTTKQT